MNNGNRALLLGVLVFSVVLNVVQAVIGPRATGASPSSSGVLPAVAPVGDFDGQVEFHVRKVVQGEDLIQLIDKTRGVICYGKMNVAGAATISCQRYQ